MTWLSSRATPSSNQRLDLINIGGAGKNKIIGDHGNRFNVDNFDIFALFLFQCFDGELYHIF